MRKSKSHVSVLVGIVCGIGGLEQRIERGRRLDRIKPGALGDRGALGNEPAVGAALDAVEETGKRRKVGLHCAEFLAHANDHRRLGYRATLGELDGRGEQMMARTGAAPPQSSAPALAQPV